MVKPQLFTILAVVSILLVLAGCAGPEPGETPSTAPAPAPEGAPGATTTMAEPEKGPLLSDALIRDCEYNRASGDFGSVGLDEGEIAVDFTLKDIHGNMVSLSGLLSEKPVVIVFGSFT